MKGAYSQITTTKHTQNLTFKNVLLSVVVSANAHCQDHKGFSIFCPKKIVK
jgi:hypothetical protein